MRNPIRIVWEFFRPPPDIPPGRARVSDDYWNDDTGETEVFVGEVDWLGTPIYVGCDVLYPGPFQRNKVQMVLGTVEEITNDGRLAVKVRRRSRDGGTARKEKVYLAEAGRGNVTVVRF